MRHPPALAVLVVALVAGGFTPAAPGSELLLNGGAEQGKGELPSAWHEAKVAAPGLKMWRDGGQPHAGKWSLAIRNTHDYPEPVSNNWAQSLQAVPVGKTIVVAASLRAEDADAANVCVQCWDPSGQKLLALGSTPVIRGDQGWTRLKGQPLVVPEGTASVTVRAALTGKGAAWFDDIAVEVVEGAAAGPVTAHVERSDSNPGKSPVLDPELAAQVDGEIVQVVPVVKDVMVLSYMADWAHGNLDNLAVSNNEGGVRLLAQWADVKEPPAGPHKYLLALYARDDLVPDGAPPRPAAAQVFAYGIRDPWEEITSWKTQPAVAENLAAKSSLPAGLGWKLVDVTALVEAKGGTPHGVMLRPEAGGEHFSIGFVSREGEGQWKLRRPVLLVVTSAAAR